MADTRIQPRLLALLGCIKDKFEGQIDLCYLGPQSGALVDLWPIGESGSMAWVRLVSVSPVQTSTVTTGRQCYVRLNADIEVGFATCYEIHPDGSSHTEDEDIALMTEVTDAQMLLLDAILCCDWHDRMKEVAVVSWSPAGPDGGAVGGAWQVSVEIT